VILSDRAIFEALDQRRLIISPEPEPRHPSVGAPGRPFDRTAVDLRLGTVLRIPLKDVGVDIDLGSGAAGPTLNALYEPVTIPENGYVLDPHTFILGVTLERVTLPLIDEIDPGYRDHGVLAARVEGKSSWARFGLLIHFTAPTIHAGFDGNIALEIMNLGASPIRLRSGMAICQLIVEQVLGHPQSAASQFQGQVDPAGVVQITPT
jgi:dCTP deaminase